MIVGTHEQVARLQQTLFANAEQTFFKLQESMKTIDAMQFFSAVKFTPLGQDPVAGTPLNLIEQINQTQSNLVVLAAAHDLIEQYPGKLFQLQLGASAGFDVASTDGQVVAECFAVTSVSSNDKMNKDCKKLMNSGVEHKHIYFYSYLDSEKKLQNRYKKYPYIRFARVYALAQSPNVSLEGTVYEKN